MSVTFFRNLSLLNYTHQFRRAGVFVFILTVCALVANSQEPPDLSMYVLDTVIAPSPSDSTVFDTTIIARRKVVVKQQVVVEQEKVLPPILSSTELFLFAQASSNFSNGEQLDREWGTEIFDAYSSVGAGVGVRTDLWERLTAGLSLSYQKTHGEISVHETEIKNYEYIDTVPYLLDEYYVVAGSDTLAYEFWEDKYETKTASDTAVNNRFQNSDYHHFCISLSVGKRFRYK